MRSSKSWNRTTLRTLVLGCFFIVPLAAFGQGSPGLDTRPSNTSCEAFNRSADAASVQLQQVFPSLPISDVVAIAQPPGDSSHWYFATRDGLVGRFANNPGVSTWTTVVDIRGRTRVLSDGGLIQLVFHPNYPADPRMFVNYSVTATDGVSNADILISSFETRDGGLTLDQSTETVLIRQPRGTNHQGGFMSFGQNGLLHIGLADGTSQGDPTGLAQNLSDFRGSVLRIDVDRTDPGKPYAVPPGNPFPTGGNDPLPEIFAWGFRNPYRGDIDPETGDIWVADVGWKQQDEVDKVVGGGNYGWNILEGTSCQSEVYGSCSDGTLLPPELPLPLTGGNCAAIGGYVYRGQAVSGLEGRFVFADYCTSKISAVDYDTLGAPFEQIILPGGSGVGQIVSFGRDNAGELYVVTGSEIYKINPVPGTPVANGPPAKLSESGCFDPADPTQAAPGLIPFGVNSALWSDGAAKRRWMALPDGLTVDLAADGDFLFPPGTVLAKEFAVDGVPVETRLFVHHYDGVWAGYSYEWNAAGTDADLLPAGKTKALPSGQVWEYPSQAECLRCHTQIANFSLGPELAQLNGDLTYPQTGTTANQLETLDHIGLFTNGLPSPIAQLPALSALDDTIQPVEDRARSYLHSNCSGCHRPSGTTQAELDFRFSTPELAMNACDVAPSFGDLGITGAKLISPGFPGQSIVLARHATTNPLNRMPPLGTSVVDASALSVLDQWVASPSVCSDTGDTDPPSVPQGLTAAALGSTAIDLNWNASSDGAGTGVAGYKIYRNGSSTPIGTTTGLGYTDAGLSPATQYSYRVRAFDGAQPSNESALSSSVAATTSAATQWSDGDIGSVSPAGYVVESGGSVTVTGAGSDIWGVSDEFHYASQSLTGDGEIVARIASLTNTDPWAKAGVMIREALTPDSAHALMMLTASNGTGYQWRSSAGGSTRYAAGPSVSAPRWVRVVRVGDVFTGYVSADGVAWTQVGSATIPMAGTVYAGLAVTSHNDGVLATAGFDSVVVGANTTDTDPPTVPQGLTATAAGTAAIDLTWNASTDGAGTGVAGYRIYRNGSSTPIATTTGLGYTDSGLSADTQYTYRVRAFDAAVPPNESSLSSSVSAKTLGAAQWTGRDIGQVSAAGSTVDVGGSVTLTGSGADIWYRADEFHFASQSLTGDGEIVARLTSLTNTHPWAKAGVMIRESLAPDSAHALMTLTPGNGSGFEWRSSAGSTTAHVGGPTVSAPHWVRLVRTGDVISGYGSGDGVTWTLVKRATIPMAATVYIGMALTSHAGGVLATAEFENVSTSGATEDPIPPTTWVTGDIGAVAASGSFAESADSITLTGSGADIWYEADEFYFASQAATDNVQITARVQSLTNTHPWSKVGVMIRELRTADSAHAAMLLSPGNGAGFHWRSSAGGGTMNKSLASVSAPYWVRLTRSGDVFRGYVSADGVNWTMVQNVTIPMGNTVQVGLALTSHDDGALATAVLDNVVVDTSLP